MLMWCITHESYGTTEFETDSCLWASCPPPELPKDWLDHVVEPSPNELKRMEIGGLELAAQFVQ